MRFGGVVKKSKNRRDLAGEKKVVTHARGCHAKLSRQTGSLEDPGYHRMRRDEPCPPV